LDQAHQGEKVDETSLRGTTLKVYRFMLKSKTPVGIHDVQRGLGLSSASVAQYHIRKLQSLALVREEGEGYVVDRVVFDNVIRIRRTAVPLQTAYVAFFASSLAILLTLFRPATFTSLYIFALIVVAIGLVTAGYETIRTLGRL
jgi:predicted DNA-binding transcriptional regulator